jgi:anthranilate synthase component 2
MAPQLLVLDNYDSFTFNLVQMFRCYPLDIQVHRSDSLSVDAALALGFDYLLISPGPKAPSSAGISTELIHRSPPDVPLLGVCLGMQCINEAYGGTTERAPLPVHGKTSIISHDSSGIFSGLPSLFSVARYHSLAVSIASPELKATAHTDDQVVMALKHQTRPLFGVQFHPESFLTEHGGALIENFLRQGPLGKTWAHHAAAFRESSLQLKPTGELDQRSAPGGGSR